MNLDYIRNLLAALAFAPAVDAPSRYQKTYPQFPYRLTVDLDGIGNIDYGTQIERGDLTTSNLALPENLVVLECVDRLLTKGYHPQDIVLEKKYKLGRLLKSGKADVVVRRRASSNKVLLIIECKTAGSEYDKELANTPATGGQIFSYFRRDQSAEFLCIYASLLTAEGTVSYTSAVLDVRDKPEHYAAQAAAPDELLTYGKAASVDELVAVWTQRSGGTAQFADKGIFEVECPAYNPGYEPRRLRDLRDFTPQDKEAVLKEFAEILRGHNVSDRSNAFNRVVSLILAKIVDEGRPADEFADFQFIVGRDDDERLYERLQTLYTRAMKEYLKEEVINHTQAEVDALVSAFPRQHAQDELRRILRELKFYSNNEFAFKEVYNETLFRANAEVLRRMVRLFEPFRFKNNGRAQVLGELFEQLLEGGYKQSEGQFFTPTPIARFLVWCLPLPEMVAAKLAGEQRAFLPRVMDYACGSGHFLTETLERVQEVINRLVPADHGPDQATQLATYQQHPMSWAKEFLYGIEKDYRLARTSQVACFMHGDGDAQIIYGDGLELHPDRLPAAPGSFDAVIANPPYSIAEFQQNLRLGGHAYELMEGLSPTSGNIEVLFIERTAQLLRPGGVAALVLPSSILSNTGLYTRTRRFLLENFRVAGLVEFGGKTFSATSTNTVALLLLRRPAADAANAHYVADDLIRRGVARPDDSQHGETHLAAYRQRLGLSAAQHTALLDADLDALDLPATDPGRQYADWLPQQPAHKALLLKTAYKKAAPEAQATQRRDLHRRLVRQREYERFAAYLLTHDQTVRLVRGGSANADQKQFLGYEYTEYYGNSLLIPLRPDALGNPTTPLCDSTNPDNPAKLNTHLRAALNGEAPAPVPTELAPYLTVAPLLDCLDLDRVGFELVLRLSPRSRASVAAAVAAWAFPLHSLGGPSGLCTISIGGTPPSKDSDNYGGPHPWVQISDLDGGTLIATAKSLTDAGVARSNVKLQPVGTVLLSFKLSIGKTGIAGVPLYTNEAIAGLHVKEAFAELVLPQYLYYLFTTRSIDLAAEKDSDNALGKSLNKELLAQVQIPLPPLPVQQAMLDELTLVETEEKAAQISLTTAQEAVEQTVQTLFAAGHPIQELATLATFNPSKAELKAVPDDTLVSFVEMASVSNDGFIEHQEPRPLAELRKGSYTYFADDDIILAKITPCMENGKGALATGLTNGLGLGSSEFHVIRAKPDVLPAYLFALLNRATVRQTAEPNMTGTSGHRRVPVSFYATMRVPALPPAEQAAFVATVAGWNARIETAQGIVAGAMARKLAVVQRYLLSPLT